MPPNEEEVRGWLTSAERLEYETRLAVQAERIADLMAENAQLVRSINQLSEILRQAAIAVAGEQFERG